MSLQRGVLVEFSGPGALLKAAEQVKKNGYTRFEVYSPFPVHGMDEAMGLKLSKLPWIVLICGMIGALSGFLLQTWVATSAYKLTISGKPFFSYQAFVPVTFELMVLFSAFGAVFGMLFLNGLPRFYHPVFKHSGFHTVSSHGFFLAIDTTDPLFDHQKTSDFLLSIGAKSLEIVGE